MRAVPRLWLRPLGRGLSTHLSDAVQSEQARTHTLDCHQQYAMGEHAIDEAPMHMAEQTNSEEIPTEYPLSSLGSELGECLQEI